MQEQWMFSIFSAAVSSVLHYFILQCPISIYSAHCPSTALVFFLLLLWQHLLVPFSIYSTITILFYSESSVSTILTSHPENCMILRLQHLPRTFIFRSTKLTLHWQDVQGSLSRLHSCPWEYETPMYVHDVWERSWPPVSKVKDTHGFESAQTGQHSPGRWMAFWQVSWGHVKGQQSVSPCWLEGIKLIS